MLACAPLGCSGGVAPASSRRAFAAGSCASVACAALQPARRARAAGATQYSTAEELLAYVRQYATRGDASSVIDAIDSFSSPEGDNKVDGWGRWMMNIGPEKARVLEDLVRSVRPSSYLEVGSFCGYSALRTLRALPHDATFVTIEKDPRTAAVAAAMFEFAGVPPGRIELIVGSSSELFGEIRRRYPRPFDMVLMDHWKPEYAPDLKRLEKLRLIKSGSVVVADNVICPGAPALLEYLGVEPWRTGWDLECDANFFLTRAQRRDVYESARWSTRLVECAFEYRPEQPDAMSVSIYKG
ncbi:hypothetical protein KFE25_013473 [Diacronema lutheri]|uniref:catechol O-methyltransferase n=2 Tax=Diacronema lutheri TaxID=2081491 RepID=A0A8J5XUX9_DIALT|nr:hypothetical protein KFE25_013473 [Diacronema lutheri]